jgi:hypothetical protein
VIVTFFPPKLMGVKPLEFVKPNDVNPTNVTTELGCNFERSRDSFPGTVMFCKVMYVQDFTAEGIWEYEVQTQVAFDVCNALTAKVVMERNERRLRKCIVRIHRRLQTAASVT